MNEHIEKEDMEAIKYLDTCFRRNVVTIDSGGYQNEVYIRALHRVLKAMVSRQFTVVQPDNAVKTFIEASLLMAP